MSFNQPVDGLPPTLTHLTFGQSFDQSIDKLPLKLTHLTTGDKFNQTVDKLPLTLTTLETGNCFNQSVDKLPPTLTHHTRKERYSFSQFLTMVTQKIISIIKHFNLIKNIEHSQFFFLIFKAEFWGIILLKLP
jgi:FNIP Repeat